MNIIVELDVEEAWGLAEVLKRMGYEEFRPFSKDEEEAHNALAALEKIKIELVRNGVDPR